MNKIVLCISGKMRSGKNQLADFIAEYINEKNLGTVGFEMFAGDLKDGAYKDFQRLSNIFKEEYKKISKIYGPTCPGLLEDLSWMDVKEEQFYEDKTLYTRALLQIYGTDIFCNRVDSNYWATRVLDKCEESTNDFILVTDTRFPNEIDIMQLGESFKTIVIRVERETDIECDHPSETSLDDFNEWNFIVDNNHSLEILKQSAKTIVDIIIDEET
jgi:hypothetical protein